MASNIVTIADVLEEMGGPTLTANQTTKLTRAIKRASAAVRHELGYDPVLNYVTEYYPLVDVGGERGRGVWEADSSHAHFRRVGGQGTNELQLRGLPIRQANSSGNQTIALYEDYGARSGTVSGSFPDLSVEGSDFWANYDGVDSSGYKFARDGILRSFGLWPLEPGSVKVSYLSGYTEDELEGDDSVLDASVIREVAKRESIRRFIQSETIFKSKMAGYTGPLTSENLGDYSYSVDGSILKSLVGFSGNGLMMESVLQIEAFVNFGAKIAL